MKRILMLADVNSAHTQKWISSLVNKDISIGLFSLSKATTNWFNNLQNFELFDQHGFNQKAFQKKTFQKTSFLKVMPSLKKAIENIKPDIVHAHYASSYGLIGALSKFHPFIISVWGSDVFDFPKKNIINKNVLKYNFSQSDLILSTSEVMKHEIELYTKKQISVTPFGIDLNIFKPNNGAVKKTNEIVIGTIKTMEDTYGISYLIRAFKVLTDKHLQLNLKLLLVGDGKQSEEYKKLVNDLNLSSKVTFTGRIPYNEVVNYHNMLDIFVAVSLRESFGVAVLEASACEKPVVVSNVGGLPEVVQDGKTGFIVPPMDTQATADAIEKLMLDKNLSTTFGKNGRAFVKKYYDWSENINRMLEAYETVLN